MNDLITIKSGALGDREAMPKLNKYELGYITDKKELYIGAGDKNVRLCGEEDAARLDVLNTKLEAMSNAIGDITARLEALESPSA